MSAAGKAALATRLRDDGATALEAGLIIDLAFNPHQARDSHGKWTRTGASPDLEKLAAHFPGMTHAAGAPQHEEIIQHAVAVATAQARAHTERQIAAQRAEHHADMAKMLRHVREANKRILANEVADKTREQAAKNVKRRRALIAHAGTVVAGGLLAYLEAKLGAPDIAVIASSMGPTIAHDLVDFSKRFSA
jgi:hypothetical protein